MLFHTSFIYDVMILGAYMIIVHHLSRYDSIHGVNGCQNIVKVTSNIGNLVTNGKIVIAGLSVTFNSVV